MPLEWGGAQEVAFKDAFAAEEAPQKIDEENSLREHGEKNGECNERANGTDDRGDGGHATAGVRVRVRDEAEPVHGHEDAVDAGEGQPEMNFTERLVQAAAKHFGEPEEQRAKNGERGGDAHDEMEMAGNEIVADGRGGEIGACEGNPGESAGAE